MTDCERRLKAAGAHGQGSKAPLSSSEGRYERMSRSIRPSSISGQSSTASSGQIRLASWPRTLIATEAARRVRDRPDRRAERQALSLALPRAKLEYTRQQAAVIANATVLKPDGGSVAPGGGYDRA